MFREELARELEELEGTRLFGSAKRQQSLRCLMSLEHVPLSPGPSPLSTHSCRKGCRFSIPSERLEARRDL